LSRVGFEPGDRIYMLQLEPALRRDMVKCAGQLAARQPAFKKGSLSAKLDEGLILCTSASATDLEKLRVSDLVKVRIKDGTLIGGGKPTPVLPAHLALYRALGPAVTAVFQAAPEVDEQLDRLSRSLGAGSWQTVEYGGYKVLVVAADALDSITPEKLEELKVQIKPDISGLYSSRAGLFLSSESLAAASAAAVASATSAAPTSSAAPAVSAAAPAPAGLGATCQTCRIGQGGQPSQPRQADQDGQGGIAPAGSLYTIGGYVGNSIFAGGKSRPVRDRDCNECGRCTKSGGSLPSAQIEAVSQIISRLSEEELALIVAEAVCEVLAEKNLL